MGGRPRAHHAGPLRHSSIFDSFRLAREPGSGRHLCLCRPELRIQQRLLSWPPRHGSRLQRVCVRAVPPRQRLHGRRFGARALRAWHRLTGRLQPLQLLVRHWSAAWVGTAAPAKGLCETPVHTACPTNPPALLAVLLAHSQLRAARATARPGKLRLARQAWAAGARGI